MAVVRGRGPERVADDHCIATLLDVRGNPQRCRLRESRTWRATSSSPARPRGQPEIGVLGARWFHPQPRQRCALLRHRRPPARRSLHGPPAVLRQVLQHDRVEDDRRPSRRQLAAPARRPIVRRRRGRRRPDACARSSAVRSRSKRAAWSGHTKDNSVSRPSSVVASMGEMSHPPVGHLHGAGEVGHGEARRRPRRRAGCPGPRAPSHRPSSGSGPSAAGGRRSSPPRADGGGARCGGRRERSPGPAARLGRPRSSGHPAPSGSRARRGGRPARRGTPERDRPCRGRPLTDRTRPARVPLTEHQPVHAAEEPQRHRRGRALAATVEQRGAGATPVVIVLHASQQAA